MKRLLVLALVVPLTACAAAAPSSPAARTQTPVPVVAQTSAQARTTAPKTAPTTQAPQAPAATTLPAMAEETSKGREYMPDKVSAGAYCSAGVSGWFGYTSKGKLMECKTSAADSRLRWRAA